jgi:hypothetical protein
LADSLRPAGGVFDAGTGIGASEFAAAVEDEDDCDGDVAVPVCVLAPATGAVEPGTLAATPAGFGALPSDPAAACAPAGRMKPSRHTLETVSRRITRG